MQSRVACLLAIAQVANLMILMFVVMFIFSIVGMQLFGDSGMSHNTRQRTHARAPTLD